MKSDRGVTLLELMIAMLIMMIASLGFLTWELNMFRSNVAIEQNNTAYTIATDVAERLQRMSDNSLLLHKSGSAMKCVGFDNGGNLRECKNAGAMDCTNGTPTDDISFGNTGMTKYTNPWGADKLYLYDREYCKDKTWTDATCGNNITITSAANSNIDHPNTTGAAYNSVNPVRSYLGVTYYAVWSIAYLPCNTGSDTSKRKVFVTVYWVTPEPTETTVAEVQTKLGTGTYIIKSVSVSVDKTIGAES